MKIVLPGDKILVKVISEVDPDAIFTLTVSRVTKTTAIAVDESGWRKPIKFERIVNNDELKAINPPRLPSWKKRKFYLISPQTTTHATTEKK